MISDGLFSGVLRRNKRQAVLLWVAVEPSRAQQSTLSVEHIRNNEIRIWIVWPKEFLELCCRVVASADLDHGSHLN